MRSEPHPTAIPRPHAAESDAADRHNRAAFAGTAMYAPRGAGHSAPAVMMAPRMLARGAALMWAVGSLICALAYLSVAPHLDRLAVSIAGAAVCGCCGVALLLAEYGDRLDPRLFQACNIAGTLSVAGLVWCLPGAAAELGLMYLWQGLYACAFFRGRARTANFVAVGAAIAAGILTAPSAGYFAFIGATLTVAIAFIGTLVCYLELLTLSDPLTGLPNRRSWEDRLHREMARAARTGECVSVAIIDLDLFKRYNDSFGHVEGDRLLRDVARIWGSTLRVEDMVARLGGEEFAVLLAHTPAGGAVAALERITAASHDRITCSAGVATWDGSESLGLLMRRADVALYDAKAGGRDRVVAAMAPRSLSLPTFTVIASSPGASGPVVPPSAVIA